MKNYFSRLFGCRVLVFFYFFLLSVREKFGNTFLGMAMVEVWACGVLGLCIRLMNDYALALFPNVCFKSLITKLNFPSNF